MTEQKTRTITLNNMRDLKSGSRIVYGDNVGTVKFDAAYVGGFRVGGRSVKNILEEYGEVTMLAE